MKLSLATVVVHALTFLVSKGEALGQLTEEKRGGHDLESVVDPVNTAQLQQTTRYTGLQDAEDNRGKSTGSSSNGGGTGSRRHHNNNNNHGARRHHDCNNNDIAECVELLEVLTNKDLGFAATVDELNKMCPVLLEGLQCIDNYTRRCLTQKHRDYFNKLYAGTIRVIKDLCNTRSRYQEEYIRHAPCMRQVNPKYNVCSVTYHRKTVVLNHMQDASVTLSEDEKNRNVIILCCSFQEYLQCSERVVFETCGNETALFTKEFLDRMAGPIVQGECSPILNLYPCPQDLFPTDPEDLPRPQSFTTDPSPSTNPTPTPSCITTPQHEAAMGGEEIQPHVPTSPPPPEPGRIVVFTHGTTQRTLTPQPATLVQDEAETAAADDPSLFTAPEVEAAAVNTHASATVLSPVVLSQPELGFESVSLHEPECMAAEPHQSSESPQEHGHRDAPAENEWSLPSLLVASSLFKLVNFSAPRWTEHDDTSTNDLNNRPSSFESLGSNIQSALYSSDSNLSLAYSLPHSRRPRDPAGKMPRRPPLRARSGVNRKRGRVVRRGGAVGPLRHVPIKASSQTVGLRPTNSSVPPWRIRHSRRHLRLPMRRRGMFRRRRPPAAQPASNTGQENQLITNTTKVVAGSRLWMQRRRFRGPVRHERTTRRPYPDEEQEANNHTLNVTQGVQNTTTVSNVTQPLHPMETFPEDTNEDVLLATIPHPVARPGNGRPRNTIGPQRHPRRRHRKPGWRRKFYRGRRPHLPGKWDGVKHKPGWRRMRRPVSNVSSHSLETTAQNETTQDNLEMSPLETEQETELEAVTTGSDTTLATPMLTTTMESETQVEWPGKPIPTSVPVPTTTTSVQLLEILTDTRHLLDETKTLVRPVDPLLLNGHTQHPPDHTIGEEGSDMTNPWLTALDMDDTTTELSTIATTTSSMTREPLLSVTHSTTTNNPPSSSNRTWFDGHTESDTHASLPEDPSNEVHHLPDNVDELWLQNLFLSEVREAVIPAPTPAPYTVRLWQEHDKKIGAKGFFSHFAPLALDVVESDFVPLTHPAITVTERDPSSDISENKHFEDSDVSHVKEVKENLQVEATLVEEVTSSRDIPPSHLQPPTTTTAAATESRTEPSNSTESPTPDRVPALAAGTVHLGDGMEIAVTLQPSISEMEVHIKGSTAEEKKEKKKTRKKKKRQKKQGAVVRHNDQSGRKKKQNTVDSQPPVTTDDLASHNEMPLEVVQETKYASSSGQSSSTQLTFTQTLSTPVLPSVSGATTYSGFPPPQPTDVKPNARIHVPPDTFSPTEASSHNFLSSNKTRGQNQSLEKEYGVPDTPVAADNTSGVLPKRETDRESGAEAPLLHTAVAVAVLLTIL